MKTFGAYRHKVAEQLSREFKYDDVLLPGQLRDIGSCWDGSKVGTVNEMDSLYVMDGDKFTVIPGSTQGVYHVYLRQDSSEIKPRRIRDKFADVYSELVSQAELPDCLKHGGYKTCRKRRHRKARPKAISGSTRGPFTPKSRFSGVRFNGPAVTSQFLAKDKTLLTWDVTPVVVLGNDGAIQEAVRRCMQPIIAENPDKMFPPGDIHLIPDATENVWRLSTAQMEADILRVLSREAPIKKALSFCKVLSSRLKEWSGDNTGIGSDVVKIIEELDRHLAIGDIPEMALAIQRLNTKMRFAHIWIPADMKEEYNEDKKSSISVNNAAVKHILLRAACKRKGAFAPYENMGLVKDLMRLVFEALGNEKSFSSSHALLPGLRISHFSVAASVASKKLILARDLSLQCKTLLQEAISEVRRKVSQSKGEYVFLLWLLCVVCITFSTFLKFMTMCQLLNLLQN